VTQDSDSGYINNRKDRHSFSFSGGIFDANAKQHEVFERVALPSLFFVILCFSCFLKLVFTFVVLCRQLLKAFLKAIMPLSFAMVRQGMHYFKLVPF
jgi:hypothetical protein